MIVNCTILLLYMYVTAQYLVLSASIENCLVDGPVYML